MTEDTFEVVEETAADEIVEEEVAEEAAFEDENAVSSGISDEDLDMVADTAIAVIEDILKYFDVGQVTIDEYEGDEGELILDITGDDLAVLIGRHGRTLDALQFLISSITSRKVGFHYPVVIDVEGYKSRQRQKFEDIARNAAERAASRGREVKLRPMTPYERRIVHIALRDDPRVDTQSEGEGRARRVVVFPVDVSHETVED